MLASDKEIVVLTVKILSFISSHVKSANTMFPMPNPISFEAHREPEYSTVFFIACQNRRPTGIENIRLDVRGLVAHQGQTNCEFS